MQFKKNIGILFFISCSQFLIAQVENDSIKTSHLKEVIVTGTRTERSVATLPLPTQIITGENIRKSGLSRLNEIIQEQTGLITVPDFGGGEGIQMQGLDAAYVMILIDGQPLFGRSAGTLDLSRISINNIERIEIVKGASSSLYGSEALAGVVNIITKKTITTEQFKGNVNYKLATFNTHDISSSLEYGKKKIGFELFGNYFKTDGYNLSESNFVQTVEPFSNFTIQPKIKINFSDKVNLLFNSRIYNQNQDYNSEIGTEKFIGKSKINEWNNSVLMNQTVSDNFKLVYDLYATNYKADEYLNDENNELFEESNFNQWFYRPEIRSHYKIGRNTLTTGIGVNYETLERTYFEEKVTLNSEYLFGQFEWFLKEKWNVLVGFRYDNHHQYQSQFSPKIGLNYKWNDHFSIKTSLGYGYKAPDLRQLYFDFTNSSVVIRTDKIEQTAALVKEVEQEIVAQQQAGWDIRVDKINLNENTFKFDDDTQTPLSYGIDFAHLLSKDLMLGINDLVFNSDSIAGTITYGSMTEQSGFVLNKLKGTLLYAYNQAYVNGLLIKTPGSEIKQGASLKFLI